jgi:predicted transcriptional regulator
VEHLVEVEKALVEQLSCDRTKMLEGIQNIKTRLEKHDNEMQAFRDAQAKLTKKLFNCAVDQIEAEVQTLINFKSAMVQIVPEEFKDKDGKVLVMAYTQECNEVMKLKNHMKGVMFQADQKPTIQHITAQFDQLMQFKEHVRELLFKPEHTPTVERIQREIDGIVHFADSIYDEFNGVLYADIVTIIKGIRELFPKCAPKDLVQWVTGMRDWNEKVAGYIPEDCRIAANVDDCFALWIQKYGELSQFREKIRASEVYTKDESDEVVITKNEGYLKFILQLKLLCNVVKLEDVWTAVTAIHLALDPDGRNRDALTTGAKTILDMKQEIDTTKALVAQYQANAATAVSDDPSTANILKLEKTKNLTLESNLATAQDQLQSANDRIRSLNASTATLQDRLDRAVERVDQLEKEKSTGSAVVQTVDIDGRVSRLLDELQDIIGDFPQRGVGDDVIHEISELLLHCMPNERLQRNFVKELVLKLQSNVDPTSTSLRLMIDSLRRDSVPPTARREGEAVDEEY